MIYERTTILDAPLVEVFDFFAQPGNLARITPPKMRFRVVDAPPRAIRQGDRLEYRMRVAGFFPITWVSRITVWRENEAFADAQERGPYKSWLHTHTFRVLDDGRVAMHDRVDYELPLGWLGRVAAGWWVARLLAEVFAYRGEVIADYFLRKA